MPVCVFVFPYSETGLRVVYSFDVSDRYEIVMRQALLIFLIPSFAQATIIMDVHTHKLISVSCFD